MNIVSKMTIKIQPAYRRTPPARSLFFSILITAVFHRGAGDEYIFFGC